MVRRKEIWIIVGIIGSILVITCIVVPTTVVLSEKNNKTTKMAVEATKISMTGGTSSTNKGVGSVFLNQSVDHIDYI
jgi:hypothetical protein